MDKFPDIFLWVILPLLVILPIAVCAQTVHCATELRRLCDPLQACTSTSDILPAIDYFIDLRNEQSTVRIAKNVGGKRVANWKAGSVPDADEMKTVYSMVADPAATFSLSKTFTTFSYQFPVVVGTARWEQHEVGTCSVVTQ
jgi:hypothetical protein